MVGSRPLCAALAMSRRTRVDGRTLDPQAAALMALHDLDPGSDLRRLSPRAARHRLVEQVAIADEPSPPGVRTRDHAIPGPASTLPARLYEPAALPSGGPAIVYFHGGGWVTGDLSTHDALCGRLARDARCRVLAVEYRLAPEHRFPAPVDDALAAVRWVLANAATLGVDAERVAVMGDRAGGNLSAVVSLRMREDTRRPALQVPLYPATDATMSMPSHHSLGEGFFLTRESIEWYRGHYLGPDPTVRRHPDVSPLFAPDLTGAPPAIVVVAGFDPLRDEAIAYAERLTEAGVPTELRELPTLPHGFALMVGALDAARDATTAIAEEIGRRLGSRS